VGDSLLHEVVCRQGPVLWVTFVYMKLYVDRFLYCRWQLVTWSRV